MINDVGNLELGHLKSEAETLDALLRLANLDLSNKPYSEVINLYFDHVPLLPVTLLPCYSKTPANFFRALKYDNEPTDIRALSYPPSAITRKGRLNIEGNPVFYASDKPLISILEIGAKVGDIIYVGIWRARAFDNVKIYPFLVNYQGNVPPLLKQKELLRNKIDAMPVELGNRYLTLYKLITEMMLGNNDDLSSVIGHFLLHDARPYVADMVIYPSIKGKRQHVNFAFCTKLVDERFVCIGATVLKVLETEKGSGKFLCLKEGHPRGQRMVWRELDRNDRRIVRLSLDTSDEANNALERQT